MRSKSGFFAAEQRWIQRLMNWREDEEDNEEQDGDDDENGDQDRVHGAPS